MCTWGIHIGMCVCACVCVCVCARLEKDDDIETWIHLSTEAERRSTQTSRNEDTPHANPCMLTRTHTPWVAQRQPVETVCGRMCTLHAGAYSLACPGRSATQGHVETLTTMSLDNTNKPKPPRVFVHTYSSHTNENTNFDELYNTAKVRQYGSVVTRETRSADSKQTRTLYGYTGITIKSITTVRIRTDSPGFARLYASISSGPPAREIVSAKGSDTITIRDKSASPLACKSLVRNIEAARQKHTTITRPSVPQYDLR
jgi:hypothetical protein